MEAIKEAKGEQSNTRNSHKSLLSKLRQLQKKRASQRRFFRQSHCKTHPPSAVGVLGTVQDLHDAQNRFMFFPATAT